MNNPKYNDREEDYYSHRFWNESWNIKIETRNMKAIKESRFKKFIKWFKSMFI